MPPFGLVTLLLMRHFDDAEEEFRAFVVEVARWINRVERRDDLISCFTYILKAGSGGVDVLDSLRPQLTPQTEEVAVSIADALREEGRVKGREEGREEGRVKGREEGRVEGREEGRVEGREEGLRKGLEAVLQLRFQLDDEDLDRLRAERLQRASASQLDEWLERAKLAASLGEVFDRPEST